MANNITEDLGYAAVKKFLVKRDEQSADVDQNLDEKLVPGSSIMEALDICLKNNFFQFNGKIYHQKNGVGTGITLAPHMHVWQWGSLRTLFLDQITSFWIY